MIAVIFEVTPAEGQRGEYLRFASELRETLNTVDGFLGVERFESLSSPGKLLSLSFFRDEAAVTRWRGLEAHRQAQAAGRGGIFLAYRLRVAAVLRDYGLDDRAQAPLDSLRAHSGAP